MFHLKLCVWLLPRAPALSMTGFRSGIQVEGMLGGSGDLVGILKPLQGPTGHIVFLVVPIINLLIKPPDPPKSL